MKQPVVSLFLALALAGASASTRAQQTTQLEEVVVTGREDSLIGIASSANEGVVGREQLALRPLLRPGELVETVPGVIVSQHSGAGKANQFFLRGFNLDHGTDLSTSFDGVPVNFSSHAHGQGWTDLNFIIPELVREVAYRKGTYYPEEGDFASAGAFNFVMTDRLDAASPRSKAATSAMRVSLLRSRWRSVPGPRGMRRMGRVLSSRSPWGVCFTPSRPCTATGLGTTPTITRNSTACCATARAMKARAGASRRWVITATGRRPIRSQNARWIAASSTASRASMKATAATVRATASMPSGTARMQTPRRRSCSTGCVTTSICSRTLPTSCATRRMAISSSKRIGASIGERRPSTGFSARSSVGKPSTRSACNSGRTTFATASFTRSCKSGFRRCAPITSSSPALAHTIPTRRSGRIGFAPKRACAATTFTLM